jgi:hypothetical protein
MKHAAASAAESASRAPTAGANILNPQLRTEQNGLKSQPFGHEAVERRQRGDGYAADEESQSGLRHAVNEAAEMLHVAFASRRQNRAGAEEQQTLEDRMVERME